jgi:hypothetical protein
MAMTMPVELPDEVARRVKAAAAARGVRPEQLVIEAVEAKLGSTDAAPAGNPFELVRDELRRMAFDGSLRSDIDTWVDDPDLAVG